MGLRRLLNENIISKKINNSKLGKYFEASDFAQVAEAYSRITKENLCNPRDILDFNGAIGMIPLTPLVIPITHLYLKYYQLFDKEGYKLRKEYPLVKWLAGDNYK